MFDYLLNVRVWHQVTGQHLVGLAGEGGEGLGFLLGEAVAQHGQLGAGRQKPTRCQISVYFSLKLSCFQSEHGGKSEELLQRLVKSLPPSAHGAVAEITTTQINT